MATTNSNIYVPTLSRAGWSKSPAEMVDFLLSDFFIAEYSQSYLYKDNITSLPYLIQRYQGDVPGLVEAMRRYLEDYLGSYLDDILVDVTSDAGTSENPTSAVAITIYIQFSRNGVVYSVGKLIETLNSRIKKIVNLNNTGALA